MLGRGLMGILVGLLAFVVTREMVQVAVTGTDTASVIVQDFAALAIAIGIVIRAMWSSRKNIV